MSWPFLKHKLAGIASSKSFILSESRSWPRVPYNDDVAENLEIKHELAASAVSLNRALSNWPVCGAPSDSRGPRLHDMRHRFATNTLAQ